MAFIERILTNCAHKGGGTTSTLDGGELTTKMESGDADFGQQNWECERFESIATSESSIANFGQCVREYDRGEHKATLKSFGTNAS